jgi:molybdopterin-guanine dinucleotide biosynthesis protein B
MMKPRVVCIVGSGRHVGKTTILIKILGEMKRRGLAVGTIKHIGGHSEFDFSDKDTARHIQAGSTVTLAVTSSEIIAIRRDLPSTLEAAISQMPKELDYILVEGFKQSKYPKVIVSSSESESPIEVPGDTIAVVLNQKRIAKDGKRVRAEQYSNERLVNMIQEYFNPHESRSQSLDCY